MPAKKKTTVIQKTQSKKKNMIRTKTQTKKKNTAETTIRSGKKQTAKTTPSGVEKKPEEQTLTCKICKCTVEITKFKNRKYCSKACYNKEKHIRENNRYHKDDPHDRTCEYCLKSVTKYGFCNACSPECRDKLAERYRIQAQKKPCKKCGNDITRARYHKYCSDQCRYEAWRDGKRKHPKNSNCRRCKNTITDKKQLVYCTAECRLKHIQEKYDAAHEGKKCENCPAMLVNVRRTYCSDDCRLLAGVRREKKRITEKIETIRNAKADSNYLKNYVKNVQQEAEERRRALRGLS